MQCYTELTPSTAVSHSISLPFVASKSLNLIIARTSIIQIFDTKSVATEVSANASDDDKLHTLTAEVQDFTGDITVQRLENTTKLVLVNEYHLSGTVSSLGRIKTISSKSGGESLLVAFRDAKISILQWDPERQSIFTVSIHYYEDALNASPWQADLAHCPCYVSVDPGNRCAVLRFGPRHIAVLPVRQLEDDLEDGYDPEIDGPRDTVIVNGDTEEVAATPYNASFVQSLTAFDPELTFPIHLAFLHEYREPTFGVLSAVKAPTTSSSLERRDIVSYKVITLDLEQKSSTTILSVTGLPTQLQHIIPIPTPIGGALLVGLNELIHVDQSGKTTAIAVNEYAKQSSSFSMADQSALGMKLEHCIVEQLTDAGDLLLITSDGLFSIITFVLDGRSVSGIRVHRVSPPHGGSVLSSGVCSASTLSRGKVFLGNEDNDSVLLGWAKKTTNIARKKNVEDEDEFSFDEDDLEDENDLYATGNSTSKLGRSVNSEPLQPSTLMFRVHDKLPNFAPLNEATFGTIDGNPKVEGVATSETHMIYPNGRGLEGGLVITRREIVPTHLVQQFTGQSGAAWSFHVRTTASKDPMSTGQEAMISADAAHHQYAIVSRELDEETDESLLYSVKADGFVPIDMGDFETEGGTVGVGTISDGSWIVQARIGELRCYNSGESLSPYVHTMFSIYYNNPILCNSFITTRVICRACSETTSSICHIVARSGLTLRPKVTEYKTSFLNTHVPICAFGPASC
jgi:cleavage and polyadenylation specificity factor subunit 1